MGVLARSLAILGMITSTKSLENHETDQERCILLRKVYAKAIGIGFHTKPSPTLGSLPAGLKASMSQSHYFSAAAFFGLSILSRCDVAWN